MYRTFITKKESYTHSQIREPGVAQLSY